MYKAQVVTTFLFLKNFKFGVLVGVKVIGFLHALLIHYLVLNYFGEV